jgi:hypothetical protein
MWRRTRRHVEIVVEGPDSQSVAAGLAALDRMAERSQHYDELWEAAWNAVAENIRLHLAAAAR